MKKPDLIKLSEFSATTLSALCDKDNAYIPAFISDTENYKVPVDDFISEEMNSWKEWSENHGSSGLNDSVYIGPNNNANGWGNTVIGTDNNVDNNANVNTVIGKENDCVDSVTNTYIFGEDNITTNDCHNNTIVGIGNDCTDRATTTRIFGTNNIAEGGNTNTVIGDKNIISGFSVNNDVFGKKNVLNRSIDLVVLGNENSASNNSVYSMIAGDLNEITDTDARGHYVIGHRNKVSGGYVFGVSNSAAHGGMAFGQYNDVKNGSYAVGDYKSADHGSLAIGPACSGVKSDGGSIAIGWSYDSHKPTEATDGAISIGRSSSADDGALALGTSVSAKCGSTSIGSNAYAENGSISMGNDSISALNGSYAIGKYGAYANNGSYIIGESSTATDGGMVIGKFGVNANGGSIAIGFNGMGASGQSISIGYNGTYAWGNNSYALGMNGVTAGHNSLAMGFSHVCATSAGMAIGAQSVTADNNTFAIGYRTVMASGAPSFAIGSQGVYAFDDGFAIGVNSVSAANDSFAIGRESVSARNQSISIGKNSNFAENYGVAIGVCNSAFNHSIMLGTNSSPSYARYGSVGIHAGDSNCPFTADNRSIAIRSTYDRGVVSTNYGGISIGRSEGYTYVNNDSIAIGKVDATVSRDGTTLTNMLSADNFSIAIGKAGYHPISVNNQSTFIGNATNASAYANNMSYIVGIAGGYRGFDENYEHGFLSADTRSLVFGGTLNKSSIVEHDSISIGFDNHGYYGAVMIGDENSGFNHYSGTAYSNQWTNAYILGDYNSVENYRGAIMDSWYGNKIIRGRDGIARTMSFIVGNDNRVTGYNAFAFGSQNMNGMSSYAWNTNYNSYSYDDEDDGFTFTFGLLNYAARNYDMALGYSSIASGGENIAIGCPIYGFNKTSTVAYGYKNISIRSTICGVSNIAVDSFDITSPLYPDYYTFNRFFNAKHLYFANNKQVRDNVISKSENITANGMFTHNTLDNVENSQFIETSNYDGYHHNTFINCKYLGLTGENVNENIIYDGQITAGPFGYLVHNIIANTRIYGGSDYSHNELTHSVYLNADVQLANSTTFTGNYVGYASYDPNSYHPGNKSFNSFIFGSIISGNVQDSFSFGGHVESDNRPRLTHFLRSVNFGNNVITNAIDTYMQGDNNQLYGAEGSYIIGRTNYEDSNYYNGPSGNQTLGHSYNIHDQFIIGQANAVIKTVPNTSTIVANNVLGIGNIINGSTQVTTNTIIGTQNKLCSLPTGVYQGVIGNGGAYKWIRANNYGSIIPHKDTYSEYNYESQCDYGYQYASAYAGFSTTYNDRNIIIGAHSLISQAINDSYILGSDNGIYNTISEAHIAEYNTLTASAPNWTPGTYNRGDIVRYNSIAYSASSNITGSYTATNPTDYWRWKQCEFSLNCYQIDNDIILGSYNFGLGGSNQFIAGFNNIASGHHSTAIGEELHSNEFQTVMGKYNIPLEGTVRTTSAYDYTTSAAYELENTGVLFIIGNGRATAYERKDPNGSAHWYGPNGVEISAYDVCSPEYIERSNAMIVSANGMVSAANFATSSYGNVENTLNDLNTATYTNAQNIASILQTFGELSALLINKPTTGNYTIGCSAGNLVWVNMQQ